MKLDPDLVRSILIEYEKLPYGGSGENVKIEGYSEEQICYHTEILSEANFLMAKIEHYIGGDLPDIFPERLTYAGHEFLEASRNDQAWKRAKQILAPTGTFILEIAKSILVDYIRTQIT